MLASSAETPSDTGAKAKAWWLRIHAEASLFLSPSDVKINTGTTWGEPAPPYLGNQLSVGQLDVDRVRLAVRAEVHEAGAYTRQLFSST